MTTEMTIEERTAAFAWLGQRLRDTSEAVRHEWAARAKAENGWFTEGNIALAINGIVHLLREKELRQWLGNYDFPAVRPRKVGVVMAGNIPAVGFHDLLCVLLGGHTLLAKLSSQDSVLLTEISNLLTETEPRFGERIRFTERLNDADAVIATGGDNSARYFRHYFGHLPHIIRQNRTSCAVLTSEETADELLALGGDITQYFGLGCRNVSKLHVPEGYDFGHFFQGIEPLSHLANNHKYANNHNYQRAIFLLNQTPHLDNGFLILTESEALVSPVAVLHYERYSDIEELEGKIAASRQKIQCIVSGNGQYPGSIPFGNAQCPAVWEYADGVDTMRFLLEL